MPDSARPNTPDGGRSRARTLALGGAGVLTVGALAAVALFAGSNPGDNGTAQPQETPSPSATPSEEPPVIPPGPLDDVELDPLQETRIGELSDFVAWLDEAGAQGYIGELGWSREDEAWNELGDYWYRVADHAGLWTSLWAAGSQWGDQYRLKVYDAQPTSAGLNTTYAPADVLEMPGRASRHGVNLAGLEFGTNRDEFSSAQPGILGQDYFDEPAASFAFLAERGIDLVRLPFTWERLQPTPGGPLDRDYAETIETMLDAAADNDIDIVLDLHNYAAYESPEGELLLGTDALPASALTDVWLRIAERWGAHPSVVAYGLMNEPHSLPGDSVRDAATGWEAISRQVVIDLREAGDDTLLMVAGYDYSSLPRWRENHPTGWIDDPADNFRYEAHHYWDSLAEGAYDLSYADELSLIGS